ncbi:UNVERIFIED_CONTAM: hypothetical protein PYX00_005368 [Menopon gallinae]|uniref:Phosphopantothenoylcysteine decarboxylase n=1 Tax=Menopon gallinae TaxID=328185 RepID=A0AAW2HRV3_9NEOP
MTMTSSSSVKKILLGCTGSVAAIKVPALVRKFMETGDVEIKIVTTERGKHFLRREGILENIEIITDDDEWSAWQKRGDPVLHIELSKWADLFLIAPLDANTLGKISSGLCDNLLTCIVRAWIPTKPLLFCPAMNTRMWEHPITSQQVSLLVSWGYTEIPVITKKLICGDSGLGAMAEIDTIYETVCSFLK